MDAAGFHGRHTAAGWRLVTRTQGSRWHGVRHRYQLRYGHTHPGGISFFLDRPGGGDTFTNLNNPVNHRSPAGGPLDKETSTGRMDGVCVSGDRDRQILL